MKINNFFCSAFFLGAAVLLAGCETTQREQAGARLGDAINMAITGALSQPKATSSSSSSVTLPDFQRGIRSIRETELAGLFSSKPLRLSNGRNAQYPRVAITVDDYRNEMTDVPRNSQCYFMHARIWDSETKFHDVRPFSVCGSDIKEPTSGFLRSDSTINIWNSGIASAGEAHSGSTRTEGPRYPQRPIPSGPLDAVLVTPFHNAFYFVHGTLTTMNFDFTQADPRVWFVKFGQLDAAGFQAFKVSSQRPANSGVKVDDRASAGSAVTASVRPLTAPNSPSVATKVSAGPAMTYAEMIKVIKSSGGVVPNIRSKLIGKSIQLSLITPGPQSLMVNVADLIFFRCVQRAPGFKGGKITAVIAGYDEENSGDPMIVLERCP